MQLGLPGGHRGGGVGSSTTWKAAVIGSSILACTAIIPRRRSPANPNSFAILFIMEDIPFDVVYSESVRSQ